ncbi:hypothetical protein D3C86_1153130 [compost metagenome]
MEHRVGDRSPRPHDAEFADSLHPQGVHVRVFLWHEEGLDAGNIQMDRDQVAGEVRVHHPSPARIAQPLLHQGEADAHGDAPQHLATGGLRVEDPPRGEGPDEAGDPDGPEVGIDLDLGELRTEGMGGPAVFLVTGHGLALCAHGRNSVSPQQVAIGLATRRIIAMHQVTRRGDELARIHFVQGRGWIAPRHVPQLVEGGLGGERHGGAHAGGGLGPARDGRLGQVRIAELEAHPIRRQAEHVGCHLRQHRVGPGA